MSLDFDESKSHYVTTVYEVVFAICSSVVPLRFFVKWKLGLNFLLCDWLIIPPWIISAAIFGIIIDSARKGELGRHIRFNGMNSETDFLKKLYAIGVGYQLAIAFIQCSLLALYWRLVQPYRSGYLTIIACIITLGELLSIIASVFQCWPIYKFWNVTQKGICISRAFSLASSGFNLVVYLLLLLGLAKVIWRLQSNLSKRIRALGLTTSFGLVLGLPIWRIFSIYFQDFSSIDVTWEMVNPIICIYVSLQISIFLACLSTIKYVIGWLVYKICQLPFLQQFSAIQKLSNWANDRRKRLHDDASPRMASLNTERNINVSRVGRAWSVGEDEERLQDSFGLGSVKAAGAHGSFKNSIPSTVSTRN